MAKMSVSACASAPDIWYLYHPCKKSQTLAQNISYWEIKVYTNEGYTMVYPPRQEKIHLQKFVEYRHVQVDKSWYYQTITSHHNWTWFLSICHNKYFVAPD